MNSPPTPGNDDYRRLTAVEAQIPVIKDAITGLVAKQDTHNTLLGTLEKVILDARHDIRMVAAAVDRIQKDQEILEKESAEIAEKTRAEVQRFGETMISSFDSLTAAFKTAIEKIIKSYDERIVNDLEPRVKKVESFNLKLNGALVLAGVVAGSLLSFVLK